MGKANAKYDRKGLKMLRRVHKHQPCTCAECVPPTCDKNERASLLDLAEHYRRETAGQPRFTWTSTS